MESKIDVLVAAILKNDIFSITKILEKDKQVINELFEDELTPLIIAVSKNNFEMAKLLLENGANANAIVNLGATALILAVEKSNRGMIELFLEFGADVNLSNEDKITALHQAVLVGNLGIVELLMDRGADYKLERECGYISPWVTAATRGTPQMIELFLRKGVDINLQSSQGRTALYWAIAGSSDHYALEKVKFFVTHGADINIPDKDGYSPGLLAFYEAQKEVFKFLMEKGAKIDIENYRDSQGRSLIVHAFQRLRRGNEDMITPLLPYIKNINAKGDDGSAALHQLVISGNYALTLIEIFFKKGADFNVQDSSGRTPLHWIVKHLCSSWKYDEPRKWNTEAMRLLLSFGSDPNIGDANGQTPLQIAQETGNEEVVKMLLGQN